MTSSIDSPLPGEIRIGDHQGWAVYYTPENEGYLARKDKRAVKADAIYQLRDAIAKAEAEQTRIQLRKQAVCRVRLLNREDMAVYEGELTSLGGSSYTPEINVRLDTTGKVESIVQDTVMKGFVLLLNEERLAELGKLRSEMRALKQQEIEWFRENTKTLQVLATNQTNKRLEEEIRIRKEIAALLPELQKNPNA